MPNVNMIKAITAFFSFFTTLFIALDRNAKTIDNLSTLGENWSDGLVKEQKLLIEKRLKDLEAKAEAKYADEQKQWKL